LPANLRVSATPRSLTVDHNGTVLSTALVCAGYAFDRFGKTGPTFSPNQHWILIDVLGPYAPGNVPRTHALVQVATGAIVLAPDFPVYLGIPATIEAPAWASGRLATLTDAKGKTFAVPDPPLRAIPGERC
jgi:hypothetical protein